MLSLPQTCGIPCQDLHTAVSPCIGLICPNVGLFTKNAAAGAPSLADTLGHRCLPVKKGCETGAALTLQRLHGLLCRQSGEDIEVSPNMLLPQLQHAALQIPHLQVGNARIPATMCSGSLSDHDAPVLAGVSISLAFREAGTAQQIEGCTHPTAPSPAPRTPPKAK